MTLPIAPLSSAPLTPVEAFALDEQIHRTRAAIEHGWQLLAELLTTVRDRRAYLLLDYPTFEDYVRSVGLETTHAYRLLRTFAVTRPLLAQGVTEERLAHIGIAKLDLVGPLLRMAAPKPVASEQQAFGGVE